METFQIKERAQTTARKHIKAESFKIEHHGNENETRGERKAVKQIRGDYKNFIFYGVVVPIHAAKTRAGDIEDIV